MQEGLKAAVRVPYRTAELSFAAMRAAWVAVQHGNVGSVTDGAVGAQIGHAGVRGGIWNVLINLKEIADAAFVRDMRQKCEALLAEAERLLEHVTRDVDRRLGAR